MRRTTTIFAAITILLMFTGAARAPQQVNWEALNPAFQGATFVKDRSVCLGCHEESIKKYEKTAHHKAFSAGRTSLEALDCESCHGPRSKHVEEPNRDLALDKLNATQRSAICLQCHQGAGNQIQWSGSGHAAAEVSCTNCHVVMEPRTEKALLAGRTEPDTCYSCHSDMRSKVAKTSHHPIREGKMACSSCHNPHGSSGPSLLRAASLNETCYTCHADKRGPFLWEHSPARDNCATCHDAHGSNNRALLVAKGSLQCLECHSYGGHINSPRYNRTSTPYGQGCVNCHFMVHGSNHPSGAKLTR